MLFSPLSYIIKIGKGHCGGWRILEETGWVTGEVSGYRLTQPRGLDAFTVWVSGTTLTSWPLLLTAGPSGWVLIEKPSAVSYCRLSPVGSETGW